MNVISDTLKGQFLQDGSLGQFLVSCETVDLEEWTTDLCSDPKEPHLIMAVQSTSV